MVVLRNSSHGDPVIQSAIAQTRSRIPFHAVRCVSWHSILNFILNSDKKYCTIVSMVTAIWDKWMATAFRNWICDMERVHRSVVWLKILTSCILLDLIGRSLYLIDFVCFLVICSVCQENVIQSWSSAAYGPWFVKLISDNFSANIWQPNISRTSAKRLHSLHVETSRRFRKCKYPLIISLSASSRKTKEKTMVGRFNIWNLFQYTERAHRFRWVYNENGKPEN